MKANGVSIKPETLFEATKDNPLCNTSYPLSPDIFASYKSPVDLMKNVSELALYFHIPFCKSLCKFCEYTRFLTNEEDEKHYLKLLTDQMDRYFASHPVSVLYGLDIGGGTPSVLSETTLEKLLSAISRKVVAVKKADGYEPSLEFNYHSINEAKASIISHYGFKRLSTGIQVFDDHLLEKNNRLHSKLIDMETTNEMLHCCGIEKINIDIMYGMSGQTTAMLENTIKALEILKPEQVTVYETRYNQTSDSPPTQTREALFHQYTYLYENLLRIGYEARFGQNTFTRVQDFGCSSYIRYRMEEGISYKGFGISAQSMSPIGISYNSLKSNASQRMPALSSISEEYNYELPPEELVAKYVSIALYGGRFKDTVISKILQKDFAEAYRQEFDFMKSNGLATRNGDFWELTPKGFKYYGAVAALFWSERQKRQFLDSLYSY